MRLPATLAACLLAASAVADDRVVFLKAVMPSQPVFRNQMFLVDLQVHFPGYDRIPIDLNELRNHPPRLQSDSVRWLKQRPELTMNQTVVNGRRYPVYHYRNYAVANQPGEVKISFQTELIVKRFAGAILKQEKHEPKTPALTLTVKPLPAEGQSTSFTGAVGQFSVHTQVDKTRVRVNTPVELILAITGRGALDHVPMPEPKDGDWGNFRVDEPRRTPTPPRRGLDPEFAKVFRVNLLPRAPGPIEIPALPFSYFNPDTQTYVEADTQPILLQAFGEMPPEKPVEEPTTKNQPTETDAPEKITQKKHPGTLALPPVPLLSQPWFLAAQTVTLGAFCVALIWRRRRDYYDARPRLTRRLRVEKLLRNECRRLEALAREKSAEPFYQLATHLLRERIGERLDIPAGGITEAVLRGELSGQLSPEATDALSKFLDTANAVRFGPATGPALAEAFSAHRNILLALARMDDPVDEV